MSESDSTTGALGGAGEVATRRGVRPTTPADGPQIAELLDEAGLRANVRAEDLHWKYWQERSDWPGSRSFVMIRGDEILAHAGVIPGSCSWGNGRVRTIHLIDWAARPNAMGAGVALMKHIGRLTDALLSIGGSALTRQILPQVGFRAFGTVTGYVRPLHPLRILRSRGGSAWRRLARVARGLVWTAMARQGTPGDGEARRIGPEQIGGLASERRLPAPPAAIFERSESLFRYFLTCPIVPMELYRWDRGGHELGYFLLAFAPRQARLVDLSVRSDDPADWRALIQCAVREARNHPNAAELVTWASDAMLAQALGECGFHARRSEPIQLCARKGTPIGAGTLRTQMLDNDAAYSLDRRADLWA